MAASIIARRSSMSGGVSEAREEITMTASRSGTTVISCPYMPDALRKLNPCVASGVYHQRYP
jgi:hypothetical protein